MPLEDARTRGTFSRAASGVLVAAWVSVSASSGVRQSAVPVVSTHLFTHADGVTSTYYRASFAPRESSAVLVFTYGGSGCVSWHDYMPTYFEGMTGRTTVLALNKRHVADDASGRDCGRLFDVANTPRQWVADYMAFISAQLARTTPRPRRIVLLGVSEGAYVAAKVAASRDDITDLAIIGDGAWTMRRALDASEGTSVVDAAWRDITRDPESLEKAWMGHPHRWWADTMDLDPLPLYLRLNIPILVGFGEQDQSVPLASALALRDAFRRTGKRNLTLRVYRNADHTLIAGATNYRRQFFQELSRRLAR